MPCGRTFDASRDSSVQQLYARESHRFRRRRGRYAIKAMRFSSDPLEIHCLTIDPLRRDLKPRSSRFAVITVCSRTYARYERIAVSKVPRRCARIAYKDSI